MNETVKTEILNQIKKYNKIVIVRHIRPDGDCMGASLGLKTLLKNTYPEKTILTISEDSSEYLAFLGKDDEIPADFDYSHSGISVGAHPCRAFCVIGISCHTKKKDLRVAGLSLGEDKVFLYLSHNRSLGGNKCSG